MDLFDDRRAHLVAMHHKGHARDIKEEELKDLSMYEFYWKFHMHGRRILRVVKTKGLSVWVGGLGRGRCGVARLQWLKKAARPGS